MSYKLPNHGYGEEIYEDVEIPYKLDPQWFVNSPFPENRTGKGVKVCLIDTGMIDHACVPVYPAVTNMSRSKHMRDTDGHVHAAGGIVAANNADKMTGLAPNCILFSSKSCDDTGICPSDAMGASILWSLVHGADIIAIPFSIDYNDDIIKTTLDKALSCHAVVIAAGGSGDVPEAVIYEPRIKLKEYVIPITTTYMQEGFTRVLAKNFWVAITTGLVALLMEKGHTIPEGKVRSDIVRKHLLTYL